MTNSPAILEAMNTALTRFRPLIPAGGVGSRLWPLSRAHAPKFLLDLTSSGNSLLRDTYDRLIDLSNGSVMVVTGTSHANAVTQQIPELRAADLVLEPSPKDSAAAIGLACAIIHRREPDAIIGSFAADHVISPVDEFHRVVTEAVITAATGKIVKLENGKNGIGISLIDRTEVSSNIPITFSTEGIGGPSAGLMFSLAIYTQLADPTLRDGRDIAGTGSISREGEVGEIGGIDKKVVSAAQSGADIFFAPNNELTEEEKKLSPNGKNNYQTALETAKKIKTDMKIVPVKTLQDAIDYLKKNK